MGPSRLCTEDLLQQSDQGTKILFPGLFLYTPHMPAILLTNICTALGQVNGARGIASGIVVDPTGTSLYHRWYGTLLTRRWQRNSSRWMICTSPACVLFQRDN
jgi:hypothetical protein